jgi:Fe-S cluster biosynthesis and repair protein YggX
MTKTVFCRKYQQELEALDRPPFPGPRGQELQASISKRAWLEWQEHQTRLINEKHLNLMEPSTRAYLQTEMGKFFAGEDYDQAEGYVPPTQ